MEGKERLPIWRDANRLLLEIEQAVRQFPRYHKYALGTDLRRQAMLICQLLVRALSAADRERAGQVQLLRYAVDHLKILFLCCANNCWNNKEFVGAGPRACPVAVGMT